MLSVAGPAIAQRGSQDAQPRLTPEQQAAVEEMADAITARAAANAEFLRLENAFVDAFRAQDYDESLRLLSKQIALRPSAFAPYYNLACVQSIRGETADALESLTIAIERGFDDGRMLETDPNLAGVRDEATFQQILTAWPDILVMLRDANLRAASMFYQSGYTDTIVDDLRVVVRSAYDEQTTAEAIDELRRVAQWAGELFGSVDGMAEPLSIERSPWVIVVLPSDRDFTRWQVAEFGPMAARGTSTVGGLYDHDRKRLVVRDLGATLRHEMMHVLHWRHMTALGQRHPIWIQEGLGAIVEDMDPVDGDNAAGFWAPAYSWRTNTAQRLAQINGLTPIHQLATLTPAEFSKRRPLAMYAEVRAWMMWLLDQGQLTAWYHDMIRDHAADPSGMLSFYKAWTEAASNDQNSDQFDPGDPRQAATATRSMMRAFRQWLRGLPRVPETGDELRVTLGIDAEGGSGDGPEVRRPTSPTALRRGDILRSIDGRPVRDLQELVRVLGAFEPGDTATVAIRRGASHVSIELTLNSR